MVKSYRGTYIQVATWHSRPGEQLGKDITPAILLAYRQEGTVKAHSHLALNESHCPVENETTP